MKIWPIFFFKIKVWNFIKYDKYAISSQLLEQWILCLSFSSAVIKGYRICLTVYLTVLQIFPYVLSLARQSCKKHHARHKLLSSNYGSQFVRHHGLDLNPWLQLQKERALNNLSWTSPIHRTSVHVHQYQVYILQCIKNSVRRRQKLLPDLLVRIWGL